MATVNIDRQVNDPFYRYTMPKLVIQNQGTKTILANIFDVGHALHRSPSYIAKFFSYELGVPIRMDTKKTCYMMSGRQNREALQDALDRFIERFVLCSQCNNPETELILYKQKADELRKVCAACGYESSDEMQLQRLTTFITKDLRDNPRDTTTANVLFDQRSGEVEQDDVSDNINDLATHHPLTILIEQKKSGNQLNDLDTIQEIITTAEELKLTEEAPLIMAKCLFTENILQEIDQYQTLFQKLCQNNRKGQNYFLYALEVLITEQKKIRRQIFHPDMILKILDILFRYNIIEKEIFIRWYEKPPKYLTNKTTAKKFRQMANPFILRFHQPDDSNTDKEDS